MGTDLIIPEILLVEKLQELDNSFAPALWDGLKTEIVAAEKGSKLPAPARQRRRMFFSDFVNKAINQPLKTIPELTAEVEKQLYRLHLFCCQQSIHFPEVKHNPLILGFHALNEMKLALMGILISYRLVDPSCPYNWDHVFFERNIFPHKKANGNIIIAFKNIPQDIINKAITEEIVTDWMIYRAYGHNGIRTLMDIKTRLQTLPDYMRGGHPADEFSRFERKMREHTNRKEIHKEETLDIEFRKTLVRTVAEQTAEKLIASGLSAQDILTQAFSADLSKLVSQTTENNSPTQTTKSKQKKLPSPPKNTQEIESIISGLLEDN